MARLYADENFPLPVVEELRRLGHDVLTAAEAAKANLLIPDEAVLRFASSENRATLTLNRKHFIRLHGQMPTTPASLSVRSMPSLAIRQHEFIQR